MLLSPLVVVKEPVAATTLLLPAAGAMRTDEDAGRQCTKVRLPVIMGRKGDGPPPPPLLECKALTWLCDTSRSRSTAVSWRGGCMGAKHRVVWLLDSVAHCIWATSGRKMQARQREGRQYRRCSPAEAADVRTGIMNLTTGTELQDLPASQAAM